MSPHRLDRDETIAEVMKTFDTRQPSPQMLHMAIQRAFESGMSIDRPNDRVFKQLRQFDKAEMLTMYHIQHAVETHVDVRLKAEAAYDELCQLFAQVPTHSLVTSPPS